MALVTGTDLHIDVNTFIIAGAFTSYLPTVSLPDAHRPAGPEHPWSRTADDALRQLSLVILVVLYIVIIPGVLKSVSRPANLCSRQPIGEPAAECLSSFKRAC